MKGVMILLMQLRTCTKASCVPSKVTYIRENRRAIEKFARQEQRKKYDEERIRQLGERTAAKIIIDQGLGNEKKVHENQSKCRK